MTHDLTQELMDDDSGYQEWSETIQKQDQQHQDESMVDPGDYQVIDLAGLSWPEVEAFFNLPIFTERGNVK